jgi:putative membrane protein
MDFRDGTGAVYAGLAAGLAGGLIGTLAMNGSQASMRKLADSVAGPQDPGERSEENEPKDRAGKNATERAYARIKSPESRREEKMGGRAVHFAFGGVAGAAYGAAIAADARLAAGAGLPLGIGMWLFANEIGLAAAGLTKPPQRYSTATHLFALTSHVVYGVVTNAVIRVLMRR